MGIIFAKQQEPSIDEPEDIQNHANMTLAPSKSK